MMFEKAESFILKKDFARARRLIEEQLRSSEYSEEGCLWAAVYYRWMGDFRKSFNLLSTTVDFKTIHQASQLSLYSVMELARVMACMGAEETALSIVKNIENIHPGKTPQQIAYLSLWFEDFQTASKYFYPFVQLTKNTVAPSYDDLNKLLQAGVCYSNQGKLETAEEIYHAVLRFSNCSILSSKVHTAFANHFILMKDYQRAKAEGFKAVRFLDGVPKSSFYYAETYLAFAASLTLCENYLDAEKLLTELLSTLVVPGASPNQWLYALFWMGLLKFKQGDILPQAWKDLIVFPKSGFRIFSEKVSEYCQIPETIFVCRNSSVKNGLLIHFNLGTDTVTFTHPDQTQTFQLGIKLIDQAICILLRAGACGISELLLYDLLWPADLDLKQAPRRISQLLGRMRRAGHKISWKGGQITLLNFDHLSCTWAREKQPIGLQFLIDYPEFTRTQLESYFSISKSSALDLCAKWQQNKLICKIHKGRTSFYRTTG